MAESKEAWVLLGNDRSSEMQRLRLLEEMFDPYSFDALARANVSAGMRCLEVGAGAGSVTAELGRLVGPSGHVVAVDIDVQRLGTPPSNVELRAQDLRVSTDLGDQEFDVVHTRATLTHIGTRDSLLESIVRALKPGGVAVIEELAFDETSTPLADGALRDIRKRLGEMSSALVRANGAEPTYGVRVPTALAALGMVVVYCEGRFPVGDRYSVSARCAEQTYRPLTSMLADHAGVPEHEVSMLIDELAASGEYRASYPVISTIARKPS